MVGSTISRYMLGIWDENPSLNIYRVYGKTNLTRYPVGRLEYYGMKPLSQFGRGELIFILAPTSRLVVPDKSA